MTQYRRLRRVRGLTVPPVGRIAPWPIATRTVGPYAVIAMSRQGVGSAFIQRVEQRLVAVRIPEPSEPTQVVDSLIGPARGFRLVRSFDHWTRHVPVQYPTVAECYAAGGPPFQGISVAMYELPLVVFTAIDLGHTQVERHRLILSAHVRLGALETDPITNVAVRGRVEGLKTCSHCRWRTGTRPVHIAPKPPRCPRSHRLSD